MTAFYEIRRYAARPGRRDQWVDYMESVVLPYQESKGVHLVAPFVDLEDPNGYVWIRRFEDEEAADRIRVATYQDPVWIEEIGPKVHTLLDAEKSVITLVASTPRAPRL